MIYIVVLICSCLLILKIAVLFFFLAVQCGIWDLSSPTRGQTHIPCIGRQILNHWTTREVPPMVLFLMAKKLRMFPLRWGAKLRKPDIACANIWRPTNWEKQRLFFSEFAIAKELAWVTWVLSMTQSQVQNWECFIVDKGKASGVPQLEAIGMEKLVDRPTGNGASFVIG